MSEHVWLSSSKCTLLLEQSCTWSDAALCQHSRPVSGLCWLAALVKTLGVIQLQATVASTSSSNHICLHSCSSIVSLQQGYISTVAALCQLSRTVIPELIPFCRRRSCTPMTLSPSCATRLINKDRASQICPCWRGQGWTCRATQHGSSRLNGNIAASVKQCHIIVFKVGNGRKPVVWCWYGLKV